MDNTEKIINNIMMKICTYIKYDDLSTIKNIICSELYNYNINEKSYEISKDIQYDNIYYINLFVASKRVQGVREILLGRKYIMDRWIFRFKNW